MNDIVKFWLSIAVLFIVLFLLQGCATKTVYVDRIVEVKVPVEREMPIVEPAHKGVNDADSLLNIIRERDECRAAIKKI